MKIQLESCTDFCVEKAYGRLWEAFNAKTNVLKNPFKINFSFLKFHLSFSLKRESCMHFSVI